MGDPANLAGFKELTEAIAQGTGEKAGANETDDRFLGRLKLKGVDVHKQAADELSKNNPKPTALHLDLLRLYSESRSVRIVTTNFDLLFETAAESVFDSKPEVFRAPALPLGREFNGIVHVHGALNRPEGIVLTDQDFGRAYLIEGWARRFLVELFSYFTILFVGYQHEDTILNYLARALPADPDKQRFALTKTDEDRRRWEMLGIEPIPYPTPPDNKYSALYEGIHRLAEYVRYGVLDWQREITGLAKTVPPFNEEEVDRVRDALRDPIKTRFFTNSASSPDWIAWLDRRKCLDGLFGNAGLSETDSQLAWWLATKFGLQHADELFLLISQHGMHLHPVFWFELVRTIALEKDLPLDADTLSRWVSFLLATAPPHPDEHALFWLGKRCIECESMDSLIELFSAMAASPLVLKPGLVWPGDDPDDTVPRITVELAPVSPHYPINELWEKGLKPNLDCVAESLLKHALGNLATQHRTLHTWQVADKKWNPASDHRHAIEPHEQDKYPEPIDVVIDAARDCLEWLASNRPERAAQCCQQLADAEAPLLRRLALHALSVRTDLAPNKKIEWLLAYTDLHDHPARNEIRRVLQQTYPAAKEELRKAVIEAVLTYRWPNEEEEEKRRRTARHHFFWLRWLHDSAPDCMMAAQAVNDVLEQYPDFQPSQHTDLAYRTTGPEWVRAKPQSPWTVEELLSRSAEKWVEDLLSFQPTEMIGPDREGLIFTVADAARREFDWGIALADALAGRGEWDTDAWSGLIRAWSVSELDEVRHSKVLERLASDSLYPKHAAAIVDSLFALVKNGGKPYAFQLLPLANNIATALWFDLRRDAQAEDVSNWYDRAINHPAGVLAEYWLGALALWRKGEDPVPEALYGEYREGLSTIVGDDTLAGRLGRSVLACNLVFLLAVDEQWTQENLIRFFSTPDERDFRAVWDGFLTSGRLNPTVAELLNEAFLQAVERMRDEPDTRRCARFVHYYSTLIAYFAEDPIGTWIPTLLKDSVDSVRTEFASQVMQHLRDLDEAQQQAWWERWLEQYCKNRLEGVPIPIEPEEVEPMLGWLPSLPAVFSEAVDLFIQMPLVPLGSGTIVYELKDKNLAKSHPKEVAKLLIHLGDSGSPPHVWYGVKELIDSLLETVLPPELEQGLKELVAMLGLK